MYRYELTLGIETTHSADGKRELIYRHAQNLELIGDMPRLYCEREVARHTMDGGLCTCERVKRVDVADITDPMSSRVLYQFDVENIQDLIKTVIARQVQKGMLTQREAAEISLSEQIREAAHPRDTLH